MLELKNVSYSVDTEEGRLDILKDIDLVIDDRFTVITGPNGSGKSTLAKVAPALKVVRFVRWLVGENQGEN